MNKKIMMEGECLVWEKKQNFRGFRRIDLPVKIDYLKNPLKNIPDEFLSLQEVLRM